jgi:FixJ family two-component response regulator
VDDLHQKAVEAAALKAALKDLSPRNQLLLKQVLSDTPSPTAAEALQMLKEAGM